MAINKSEVMIKWAINIIWLGLLMHSSVFANLNRNTIGKKNAMIITVAQNGTAQFKKIQLAINSIVLNENQNVVIKIAPGIYDEKIRGLG